MLADFIYDYGFVFILCLGPMLLLFSPLLVRFSLYLYRTVAIEFPSLRLDNDIKTAHLQQLQVNVMGSAARLPLELKALEMINERAKLDLPLVSVTNGLHKMQVARALLVDGELATELVARAIETTRTKPLDNLQHLNYAPRIVGADAQADADLSGAMDAIDGLLDRTGGELDMHINGSNGDGKH